MKTLLKSLTFISVVVFPLLFYTCNSVKNEIKISVTNSSEFPRTDAFISFNAKNNFDNFSLYDGKNEIPSQVIKSAKEKTIAFVVNLAPTETKSILMRMDTEHKNHEYKSRTYAELSMKPGNIYMDGKFRGDKFVNVTKIKVPAIHTDHDALFRYEGPGWESEKVGYRFYLDWRNANDIFGKKVNKLVLANVGVHDTVAKDDSYHSMLDWGMDIFKVGNSLGIGSIGMWNGGKINMVSKTDSVFCEITENGPVLSEIKTSYYGWKVGENKFNLVSKLSITAGSRMTKCELEISDSPDNIVTGLAKYEGTDFIKNSGTNEWAYIALYGKQTLVNSDDELGIAVFYRKNNLTEFAEDDLNYFVKLKPDNGKIEYYFCAAWDQEPDGIRNKNEFQKYLNTMLNELDYPIIVNVD